MRLTIAIARRLSTVVDSDRIMHMDHGKVVEFDTPSNLISKSDGFFTSLLNEMGESASVSLKKMIMAEEGDLDGIKSIQEAK